MRIERVGVVGAGTMGAGIAQIACMGGYETFLHDPDAEALAAGEARLLEALTKGADRGRWPATEAGAAAARLHAVQGLSDLDGCDLVIEAAPEDLGLKRSLFTQIAAACGDEVILATNTSSLSVTAIATGVPGPERVVGMHFFNPPALMQLVEVVAGEETSEDVLAAVTEVARQMGRTPVRAGDEIGFIANRCARPYSLEGLHLLGDRIADHQTIDRICRIGGGFRMGPFELMDLVGVDVNFEVAKSFWEQSFHEPRWQPHPIQQRMVDAGRLGRKSGRGYYDYAGGAHRPDDPELPEATNSEEAVVIRGDGFEAISLHDGSLASRPGGEQSIGFVAIPSLSEARLVELARGTATTDAAGAAAEAHFEALGKRIEWVGDSPGLVLGRIVSQLVNEAAFALQKGIGSAADIDTAMRLGFNYPLGPLEWGERIGLDRIVATLDALHRELGEERYRVASALRRMA